MRIACELNIFKKEEKEIKNVLTTEKCADTIYEQNKEG